MFKVVKTEISKDEFVKEIQELFPSKFTTRGLEKLFDYIEFIGNGEYQPHNIDCDYKEWSFKKLQECFVVKKYYKGSSQDLNNAKAVNSFLNSFLDEDDEWNDLIVGITDSTIVITAYCAEWFKGEQ